MKRLKKKTRNRSAQGLVEYALILALVALVVITALTAFGTSTSDKMNTIATNLESSG